jgi:hypothetical protein
MRVNAEKNKIRFYPNACTPEDGIAGIHVSKHENFDN